MDFVDGADVGMLEPGGGARFQDEAFPRLGIAYHLLGKKLQGNRTIELEVFGLTDNPHASPAHDFQNSILACQHGSRRLFRGADENALRNGFGLVG